MRSRPISHQAHEQHNPPTHKLASYGSKHTWFVTHVNLIDEKDNMPTQLHAIPKSHWQTTIMEEKTTREQTFSTKLFEGSSPYLANCLIRKPKEFRKKKNVID